MKVSSYLEITQNNIYYNEGVVSKVLTNIISKIKVSIQEQKVGWRLASIIGGVITAVSPTLAARGIPQTLPTIGALILYTGAAVTFFIESFQDKNIPLDLLNTFLYKLRGLIITKADIKDAQQAIIEFKNILKQNPLTQNLAENDFLDFQKQLEEAIIKGNKAEAAEIIEQFNKRLTEISKE